MYIVIGGGNLKIEIPSADLLPGHLPSTSTISATIEEVCVTGMLFPRLVNLKHLNIYMVRHKPRNDKTLGHESSLIRGAMSRLFTGFDPLTAHPATPPLLPGIEYIHWNLDELHWALAKSPKLTMLVFERPCKFLPDAAPQEFTLSMELLNLTARSSILNPATGQVEPLLNFVTHFPAVEYICLTIHDTDYDDDVSQRGQLDPE
jgi:hypothetical protein